MTLTTTDVMLLAASLVGVGAQLGWYAGSRWRRAHDAARYAQIDLRRDRAYVRRSEALANAIAVAAAAIEKRQTVLVDYSFAIDALDRSGFDVTPKMKPQEKH